MDFKTLKKCRLTKTIFSVLCINILPKILFFSDTPRGKKYFENLETDF